MEVKPGYKETEVGVIPEEWEVTQVGRTTTKVGSGITPTGGNRVYKSEGRPFMRSQNVGWGTLLLDDVAFIDDAIHSTFADTEIKSGDVFLNITGASIGRSSVADSRVEGGNVNQHVCIVRADQGRLTPRFLNYLLLSSLGQGQIDSFQAGGNRQGLNFAQVRSICLPVPPLPEQRSIVEALSDVDTLLGALDRFITKKRDLKQAAMQQLLAGETHLPGFHGKWPIKTFGELFNFSGGFSASRDQLSSEGHCYLHYGDIHGATKTFIDLRADCQNIPKLDIPLKRVASKSMLEDGDIVFVDASEDDEGTSRHIVVVNKEKKPFISGLHTIVAKSKTDELKHEYRRYCFQTAAIRQQFLFYAVGTKVSGINKSNIPKLTLPVPSVSEQGAIAEVLRDMDAELAVLGQRRDKTRDLKQAMMQALLTGRIRFVSAASNVVSVPQKQKEATAKLTHNWQINEAVIIGVLAGQFGTEEWPLPRKRQVKLTYLLHRHVEGKADGYLKKAAGPYNPKTKYQGPEGIALKNRYVRKHSNGTYVGFVAAEKIARAEQYFADWYPEAKEWLEQFRFEKTDELELLATIDMAVEDLRSGSRTVELNAVKDVIRTHPEWEAKLSRPIFSDDNITRAITKCSNLFVA
jgi:type I restriction enzyme S subunit